MPTKKKTAKKTTNKRPLTPKQEAFTEHYLGNGFNGVQAARKAGYKGQVGTLNEVARTNLQKPAISSHVRARLDGVAANTDEVLKLLGDHLRASLGDFVDCFKADGSFDLAQAEAKGIAHLIKRLRQTSRTIPRGPGEEPAREVTLDIELHNSQDAAGKLIHVLGLKQQARANDDQLEHDRQMTEQVQGEIARLVEAGWSEAAARSIILEAWPEAGKWLQ